MHEVVGGLTAKVDHYSDMTVQTLAWSECITNQLSFVRKLKLRLSMMYDVRECLVEQLCFFIH